MFQLNTEQIIDIFLNVIKEYDNSCRGFFGKPGKEGINRKVAFLKIISGLYGKTPNEAFTEIYDFYLANSESSRLNCMIKRKLMLWLGISDPIPTGNIYRYSSHILKAELIFLEKASNIKAEVEKNKRPYFISFSQIRKNARLLGQSRRTGTGSFKDVPDELLVFIAAYTGNPVVHDAETSEKIARRNLGRPQP